MDGQKMIDETHTITDSLEREALDKLNNAQVYYNGYVQACEDFGRRIRQMVYEEGEKEDEKSN